MTDIPKSPGSATEGEEKPFRWTVVKNKDELEAFYRRILHKLREAACFHGYALGVHGSLRRDLDLIAVAWIDGASDRETLVRALHKAACGLTSQSYQWEEKPNGRMATCFPICFPEWHTEEKSLGHIDLSVAASPSAAKSELETYRQRAATAEREKKIHCEAASRAVENLEAERDAARAERDALSETLALSVSKHLYDEAIGQRDAAITRMHDQDTWAAVCQEERDAARAELAAALKGHGDGYDALCAEIATLRERAERAEGLLVSFPGLNCDTEEVIIWAHKVGAALRSVSPAQTKEEKE